MKSLILSLCLLASTGALFAQNDPSIRIHLHDYAFVSPGLTIGYEKLIFSFDKVKTDGLSINYQLFAAPQLGIYFQKNNHIGVPIGSDLGFKRVGAKGFEAQVFAGAAYLRTFLSNDAYIQNSNGEFEVQKWAGNNHFQWSYGLGVGYNFMKTKNKPISINMRVAATNVNFPGSPPIVNAWFGVNYYFKK